MMTWHRDESRDQTSDVEYVEEYSDDDDDEDEDEDYTMHGRDPKPPSKLQKCYKEIVLGLLGSAHLKAYVSAILQRSLVRRVMC